MPNRLDRSLLVELLACHATPGDEAEVRSVLERQWRAAGWEPRRLGDLAVTAAAPQGRRAADAPLLLVCAHMDSPGYAIHALGGGTARPCWPLTEIGGPSFAAATTPGRLKCGGSSIPVTLRQPRATAAASGTKDEGAPVVCRPLRPLSAEQRGAVRHGDRVCFAAEPAFAGDRVTAPFLDNRLGCWLVAELPRLAADWRTRHRIVVAATGGEEFNGHGAAVLAHHIRPDLTVVIDATYASDEQRVTLGGGPVLTLSDRSVLISPARRDALQGAFDHAGIPLQTEVYNYSGTDARAFPALGIFTPVLPLLIATTGNHTPRETADLRDAEALLRAIRLLAF